MIDLKDGFDNTSFLVKLKELCDEYDNVWGSYPENQYEGESVYRFAIERSTKTLDEIKSENDLH